MQNDARESWRVILFTDFPGVAADYRQFFTAKGHRLVGLVISPKRNPDYLEVARAVGSETDVLISNHRRRWAAMLHPLQPDLIVTAAFPLRLPEEVLALPRLGAVNAHPTLLPRYRGTDTLNWMLRHGEREGGMTLHRMVADFDAGPILAQVRFEIGDDDDVTTLFQKLAATGPALWEAALPRIAAGDPGEPQDEARASYYGKIEDLDTWRRIDWSRPAREVHNVVRSCAVAIGSQAPGAIGEIEGVPTRITKTRLIDGPPSGAVPGTVVERSDEALIIACGDGALQILEHQPV